jgi:hypothetical protein
MFEIEKLDSFNNWRNGNFNRGHWPLSQSLESYRVDWKETFMIGEVPQDDKWDTHSTSKKLALENLYIKYNVHKQATRHYMNITSQLTGEVKELVDSNYGNCPHHSTWLKLPPGNNLMWHYDSYNAFVHFNKIPEEKYSQIKRIVVMMTDWSMGQTIQIGNEVVSHWKFGDTFSWQGDIWHGAGNFGLDDLVVFQVTYLED